MPKNSTMDLLKRLRAMEKLLGEPDGLYVPKFAKKWAVSEKTVYRDVEVLRKLGGADIEPERDESGRWIWHRSSNMVFADNLADWLYRRSRLSCYKHDWVRVGILVRILGEQGQTLAQHLDQLLSSKLPKTKR